MEQSLDNNLTNNWINWRNRQEYTVSIYIGWLEKFLEESADKIPERIIGENSFQMSEGVCQNHEEICAENF